MNIVFFLQQTLQNDFLRWFFFGPLALILVDVLTGIMAAMSTHTFDAKHLSAFLGNDLTRFMMASFLVLVAFFLFGGMAQATTVATLFGMGSLTVSIGQSISSNIAEIVRRNPQLPLAQVADEVQPALVAAEKSAAWPSSLPVSAPMSTPIPDAWPSFQGLLPEQQNTQGIAITAAPLPSFLPQPSSQRAPLALTLASAAPDAGKGFQLRQQLARLSQASAKIPAILFPKNI